MPTRPVVLAVAAALIVLGACDTGDGTTLRPPPEGAATPLPATPATVSLPDGEFSIASSSFTDQGLMPARHTLRDGQNVSPPLQWGSPPEGTVELALVVTDVAESAAVHWVLGGVDPTSVGIEEGQVPPGAVQAQNDFAVLGWTGPNSTDGTVHTYVFTLYALAEPLDLPNGTPAATMLERIDAITINTAEVAALYE